MSHPRLARRGVCVGGVRRRDSRCVLALCRQAGTCPGLRPTSVPPAPEAAVRTWPLCNLVGAVVVPCCWADGSLLCNSIKSGAGVCCGGAASPCGSERKQCERESTASLCSQWLVEHQIIKCIASFTVTASCQKHKAPNDLSWCTLWRAAPASSPHNQPLKTTKQPNLFDYYIGNTSTAGLTQKNRLAAGIAVCSPLLQRCQMTSRRQ